MREGFVPAEFQSTRPVRGATKEFDALAALVGISIHAPRAGRDYRICSVAGRASLFQSTRPVRGATFVTFAKVKKI